MYCVHVHFYLSIGLASAALRRARAFLRRYCMCVLSGAILKSSHVLNLHSYQFSLQYSALLQLYNHKNCYILRSLYGPSCSVRPSVRQSLLCLSTKLTGARALSDPLLAHSLRPSVRASVLGSLPCTVVATYACVQASLLIRADSTPIRVRRSSPA